MTVRALTRVPVAAIDPPRVFKVRQKPQMFRVNAPLNFARMVKRHTYWHGAINRFPCGPVCQDHMPLTVVPPANLRVTVASDRIAANPAPRRRKGNLFGCPFHHARRYFRPVPVFSFAIQSVPPRSQNGGASFGPLLKCGWAFDCAHGSNAPCWAGFCPLPCGG